MNGGQIDVNSDDAKDAIRIENQAQIAASKGVNVVGGIVAKYSLGHVTHNAAVADPLAGLPKVDPNSLPVQSSGGFVILEDITLQPGRYKGLRIGGHSHVTLAPGLYLFEGPLVMGGSSSLSGNGVTLVFEEGLFDSVLATGDAHLSLSPATSGPYAGIVLFKEGDDLGGLALLNATQAQLNGIVYGPSLAVVTAAQAHLNGVKALIVNDLHMFDVSHVNVSGE